jgi:hypothetical protein
MHTYHQSEATMHAWIRLQISTVTAGGVQSWRRILVAVAGDVGSRGFSVRRAARLVRNPGPKVRPNEYRCVLPLLSVDLFSA